MIDVKWWRCSTDDWLSVGPQRKRSSSTFVLLVLALVLTVPVTGIMAQEEVTPEPSSESGGILLNFDGASLGAVLEYLSEVAGLVVIIDVPVDGRVSIISRQPLSVEEAVSLLNTALKEHGYAAIRMGRVLKIVALEEAKKMNIPVRSGNDPTQIEATDEMIVQVIPVRFADAVKLKEDLASLIPTYAELSANASSNTLILTDTGANVRRLVEIVQALDTHMSTVAEVKVFQLAYADAEDTAQLINEIFKEEEQQAARTTGRDGGMRMMFRGPRDQQETDAAGGGRGPKVVAVGDERTNIVVVTGPADTLEVVADVIKELDANPAEEEGILVYSLKNAQAENLETVLNELFSETEQSQTGRTSTARGQTSGGRPTGFARIFGGTQSSAGTEQAIGALSGQVHIVADEDTNSLLILTAPENFDRMREILAELDRPVPQVLIKVLIAEVTHGTTVDLGVEFSALNIGPDHREVELFTDFSVAGATGGLIYKLVRGDVTAALRALEEVGKLDVLSRPYILASNNQPAIITVGAEVPFITQSRTTETGQIINTISYEDIGIILEVTPHINSDGLVIMDVRPEVSTIQDTTIPLSETFDAPIFAKRSAESRVAIRDGQTIVIGGLIEDRKTATIRKVPLLGSIPLLGMLFRRTINEKAKTELLIFLTPHVAHEAGQLQAMSKDELAGSKVIGTAVEPGAFDKHMKRMQSDTAPAEE